MTDDDEITTDVDPAWVAALRAEAAGDAAPWSDQPPAANDGAACVPADWFDDDDDDVPDAAGDDDPASSSTTGNDPPGGLPDTGRVATPSASADDFDAEATVGASSELLARIRAEVAGDPDDGVGADDDARPTPPDASDSDLAATPDPRTAPPTASAPAPPLPPPVVSQPATSANPPADTSIDTAIDTATDTATRASTDAEVSTTVRWEPRQRLSGTVHVAEAPLASTEQRHHGLDRTRIVIAVIVAVTVVVLAWLFLRGDDGDPAPAPTGSVPTETTPEGAGG